MSAVFSSLWPRFKTGFFLTVIAGLVLLNIATLINDTVHRIDYGVIAAVATTAMAEAIARAFSAEPILGSSPTAKRAAAESRRAALESENKNLKLAEVRRKKALQGVSHRIAQRTAASAVRGARSLAGRSLPYVGIALSTTLTTLDIRDACETIKDLNQLSADSGGEAISTEMNVCGMRIPDSSDIASAAQENARAAYRGAAAMAQEAGGTISSVELPSVSWAQLRDFLAPIFPVLGR